MENNKDLKKKALKRCYLQSINYLIGTEFAPNFARCNHFKLIFSKVSREACPGTPHSRQGPLALLKTILTGLVLVMCMCCVL